MTIYVSLPITGYNLTERKRLAEWCRQYILRKHPDARVVTPFDIGAEIEAAIPLPKYEDYMGADLAFLIGEADMVYFYGNPRLTRSNGVRLEFHAARIYHKKIRRIRR